MMIISLRTNAGCSKAYRSRQQRGRQEPKRSLRDLDDSLVKALHAKHKLGQSNLYQDSLYVQLWDQVQPIKVETTQ